MMRNERQTQLSHVRQKGKIWRGSKKLLGKQEVEGPKSRYQLPITIFIQEEAHKNIRNQGERHIRNHNMHFLKSKSHPTVASVPNDESIWKEELYILKLFKNFEEAKHKIRVRSLPAEQMAPRARSGLKLPILKIPKHRSLPKRMVFKQSFSDEFLRSPRRTLKLRMKLLSMLSAKNEER